MRTKTRDPRSKKKTFAGKGDSKVGQGQRVRLQKAGSKKPFTIRTQKSNI